ncbi:MAG TPA: hypothetical protein VF450_26415 [Noviherbaspirillum sp.]
MDQTTINLIIGGCMACLGWFARTLYDGQKELRSDLNKLQVSLSKDYVSFDVLRAVTDDLKKDLKEDLRYIRDRLDALSGHRRKEDE